MKIIQLHTEDKKWKKNTWTQREANTAVTCIQGECGLMVTLQSSWICLINVDNQADLSDKAASWNDWAWTADALTYQRPSGREKWELLEQKIAQFTGLQYIYPVRLLQAMHINFIIADLHWHKAWIQMTQYVPLHTHKGVLTCRTPVSCLVHKLLSPVSVICYCLWRQSK